MTRITAKHHGISPTRVALSRARQAFPDQMMDGWNPDCFKQRDGVVVTFPKPLPVDVEDESFGMARQTYFWLNIYTLSRRYGGPEEGGWYYNWQDLETAILVPAEWPEEKIAELVALMEEAYARVAWGNLGGVLGGQEVIVVLENTKGETQSTTVPHYE